jgi:hypothetical protein
MHVCTHGAVAVTVQWGALRAVAVTAQYQYCINTAQIRVQPKSSGHFSGGAVRAHALAQYGAVTVTGQRAQEGPPYRFL